MRFLGRAGFFLFVLAALSAGAWAYIQLKKGKKPARQALSLLPAEAVVYAQSSDLPQLHLKLSSRSMAVDGLRILSPVNTLCETLRYVDSLCELSPPLKEQLEGNDIHLAIYGKNEHDWLLCFNLKSLGDLDRMKAELKPLLGLEENNADEGYLVAVKGLDRPLRITFYEGVILMSNSGVLLKQAVTEGSPRLADDSNFAAYRLLHPGGQVLSVYVDHERYVTGGHCEKLDLSLICHSGYSGMDIEPATSEIRLNGYLKPSGNDRYGMFEKQQPFRTASLLPRLPGGCGAFVALAFDSMRKICDPVQQHEEVARFWKKANDSAMYNVQRSFSENAGGCLAEFNLEASDARMLMLTVRDSAIAREQLAAISDTVIRTGIACYKLSEAVPLFQPVSENRCAYAIVYNDALYFAPDRVSVMELSGILQQNDVLAVNNEFMDYSSEHISDGFNFLAYCSPQRSSSLISKLFSLDTLKAEKAFENFRHFSYSIVNTGTLRTRMHLLYSAEKEKGAQSTLWSQKLDTIAVAAPALFTNFRTGENEVVVQDLANNLYLLSSKGEVIWKKRLEEKIVSAIYKVDAFKNNKLQMLFNTAGALHLIDRNGNYVEGYPVKLKARATCAMSLFDYEKTKDYRLIVPCSDRLIYNYSIEGKEPATYQKPQTEAEVCMPVQYANIAGREFLVAIDSEGKIYGFNRRGELRVSFSNRVLAGCRDFHLDIGGNTAGSYIVYIDEKNALLNKISFADKKLIVQLDKSLPDAGYRFANADNNKFMDVIMWGGGQAVAYDFSGNRLYSRSVPCSPALAGFNNFAARRGSYIYCRKESVLWIHDRDRQKLRAITAGSPPLFSDLFRNKEIYVLLCNGDRVDCSRLP